MKLLLPGTSLRLHKAFPDQNSWVDDAPLESLGCRLAAGVGRSQVLAHLLDDGQQLRVLGHGRLQRRHHRDRGHRVGRVVAAVRRGWGHVGRNRCYRHRRLHAGDSGRQLVVHRSAKQDCQWSQIFPNDYVNVGRLTSKICQVNSQLDPDINKFSCAVGGVLSFPERPLTAVALKAHQWSPRSRREIFGKFLHPFSSVFSRHTQVWALQVKLLTLHKFSVSRFAWFLIHKSDAIAWFWTKESSLTRLQNNAWVCVWAGDRPQRRCWLRLIGYCKHCGTLCLHKFMYSAM